MKESQTYLPVIPRAEASGAIRAGSREEAADLSLRLRGDRWRLAVCPVEVGRQSPRGVHQGQASSHRGGLLSTKGRRAVSPRPMGTDTGYPTVSGCEPSYMGQKAIPSSSVALGTSPPPSVRDQV